MNYPIGLAGGRDANIGGDFFQSTAKIFQWYCLTVLMRQIGCGWRHLLGHNVPRRVDTSDLAFHLLSHQPLQKRPAKLVNKVHFDGIFWGGSVTYRNSK